MTSDERDAWLWLVAIGWWAIPLVDAFAWWEAEGEQERAIGGDRPEPGRANGGEWCCGSPNHGEDRMTTTKTRPAKSPLEVLVAARWILVRWGWRQGAFGEGREPHCVMGALREVDTESGLMSAAESAMCKHLGVNLTWFNDAPDCTFGKVLALMDRVIAGERAREARP